MARSDRVPAARAALGVALALFLAGPVAAARAEPCLPGEARAVALTTQERGEDAPLIATHDATIRADTRVGQSISLPPDVRVTSQNAGAVALIVPSTTNVAVTVSWQHQRDDDTQCSATQTTALPVKPAHPVRALPLRRPSRQDLTGHRSLIVIPSEKDPNLDPLEVSIRATAGGKRTPASTKPREMVVPMRTVDQIEYEKKLPVNPGARLLCRFFLLTCDRLVTTALSRIGLDPGTLKPDLDGARFRLARTQPLLEAARYGIEITVNGSGRAYGGERGLEQHGYDLQVRQSGRLVARLRRAQRCRSAVGRGPTCRTVRQTTSLG